MLGELSVSTKNEVWTMEEDHILAQTVLQYIREGKTQLNAFECVSEKLKRTANACGYRWNAEVRKKYQQEIEEAKKERHQNKRTYKHETQGDNIHANFSLHDCISYLQSLEDHLHGTDEMKEQNQELKQKFTELKQENDRLNKRFHELAEKQKTIEQEYEMMVKVLQKASSLMAYDESTVDTTIH